MDARDDPSNPSGAYARMVNGWASIDDILAGPHCIRSKGQRYLPKNPAETQAEYDRRLACAPWQPEFEDILQSLSSKPFGQEVSLKDGASTRIKELAEDIDGRGDNLTAFCRPVFRAAIATGMHAILVDNTGRGAARTQAEERAAGVRPYWVAIRAEDILDLKTAFVGGREQSYHVRIRECRIERDGYAERSSERIRELNREAVVDGRGEIVDLGPPTWRLHEKQRATDGKEVWVEIDAGVFSPLAEIPLATFWTGSREGPQYVRPPLVAIADKQIELYRALSRNEEAFYSVGYPMYAANGLGRPQDGETIETGPNRILYAPAPQAEWKIISADADALRVLLEDVEARTDAIRRLGMQPLTQRSGGVTATASSIEGAKAHSTVEAWALAFKDVLEQAFVFTSKWLGEEADVEVNIHTDFMAGVADPTTLTELREARKLKEISHSAYVEGLQRFSVLPADFDAEEDDEMLAEENQGLAPESPDDPDDAEAPPKAA